MTPQEIRGAPVVRRWLFGVLASPFSNCFANSTQSKTALA
jgi:hypothetical protein